MCIIMIMLQFDTIQEVKLSLKDLKLKNVSDIKLWLEEDGNTQIVLSIHSNSLN